MEYRELKRGETIQPLEPSEAFRCESEYFGCMVVPAVEVTTDNAGTVVRGEVAFTAEQPNRAVWEWVRGENEYPGDDAVAMMFRALANEWLDDVTSGFDAMASMDIDCIVSLAEAVRREQ